MLDALGLVAWRPRADGPLAGGRRPGPAHPSASDRGAGPLEQADGPERSAAPSQPAAHPVQHSAAAAVEAGAAPGTASAEPDIGSDRPAPQTVDIDPVRTDHDDKTGAASAAPAGAPLADMDWDALEAWLGEQDHRGAQRPVFGVGARDADVLIVGEAPGANEDAQGVPFVGRAGQLLDRMLAAIGCSRQHNVYITNICKFRPPNNRDPNADEVAADWPVLERQIELMDPMLVVAVGRVAAQTLLDTQEALGKMRGRMHRYPRRELDVLVTYHPAYLLRSPQQKARAWEDLKRIAHRIAQGRAAP
ncbi:uracil-DNA glycosylase [Salinisphaera sp. T31B1]|uniref:uracil-DNA glycosylase n=1 Tax=Salinisphaera sp. T31B1 TaxID=727963 RepID=UPI0033402EE6